MKIAIFYIFTFLLLVLSFKLAVTNHTAQGKHNNKGYGKKSDSVATLIDRIDWANNYPGRIELFFRYILYSIIISFVLCLVIQNSLPSPLVYTQCVVVTWILLRCFYYYTQHHCDKYSNYAIDRNINMIRKKLNLKKGGNLSVVTRISNNSSCRNFTYRS